MQYDRKIVITTGVSRKASTWKAQALLWSELITKLASPVRGTETLKHYLQLPKAKQDELKDVGGFVGGTFNGEKRKADKVTGRDLITLDMDSIPAEQTNNVLQRISALGCGYCVYSTRKHEPARPRLRGVFPLDRCCTPDEYEPIARKLAELIGIELCDPTTFQASRLMYWPSASSDSQYVYVWEDKPLLSADGMLALYGDWHDIAQWPDVPNAPQLRKKLAAKQGDPTEKSGIVGAFCRVYDIYTAMEKFLPGVYTETAQEDRYTYAGGSTTGGAVIYDDGKFLYSNHATDPAGGKLCNAFDLVRLHKFADRDEEAKDGTPTVKLPSYAAMCELAAADNAVTTLLTKERRDKAAAEFSMPLPETAAQTAADIDVGDNWESKLAVTSTGLLQKTIDNVLIILENDPLLKNKFAFDDFSNRVLIKDAVPWDLRQKQRDWSDNDDAGIRHYLERAYGITGINKITDACTLCFRRHSFNAVQDWLRSLPPWDSIPRLDTIFIDYLGAADTPYTRAVARKSFTAAVARAMIPGVKYDTMPILSGPQGIGKSTLLKIMAGNWFNDSLDSFDGKEACEMIQGSWIIELGELNGLSKSESGQVKQFLSKADDIYREPYGRRTGRYPRRCVFFGTSNEKEYLKDSTGGRRFWPIDCMAKAPTKSVFTELELEAPQIWAEAYVRWQVGEKLYLEGAAAAAALVEQESHREANAKEGIVREFIERKIPADWSKRTLQQRRSYWSDEFGRKNDSALDLVERTRVCALEIWAECFGGDVKYMKKSDSREINDILSRMEGWKRAEKTERFGAGYGVQRGFQKL